MLADTQQISLFRYQLEILNVKMKIKFNCKMRIEYLDQALTSDIEAGPHNQSLIKFGHKCQLAELATDNNFGLSICLITNKGNKYPAGVGAIYYSDLHNMGNNQIRGFKLSKCLDPQACIELRIIQRQIAGQNVINKVKKHKQSFQIPIRNNIRDYHEKPYQKNRESRDHLQDKQTFGYQSQARLSGVKPIAISKNIEPSILSKSRSRNQVSIHNRSQSKKLFQTVRHKNHSPIQKMESSRSKMKTSQIRQEWLQNQQQSIEHPSNEAYKKLQQKLKHEAQKSQKEFQKRLALQDIEGALKLEVLRYKIKCEQVEKGLSQKTEENKQLEYRNKQLAFRCSELQEQLQKVQDKLTSYAIVDTLQDEIRGANKQLEELRDKNMKMVRTHNEKQIAMKKEIDSFKFELNRLEEQLEKKTALVYRLNKENENNKTLQQDKNKIIQKLEEEITVATYQQLNQKDKELKSLELAKSDMQRVIEQLSRKIALLESEKLKKAEEMQSSKTKISSVEYNYTLLMKTNNTLQQELGEIPKLKSKINEQLLMIRKLEGDKKSLQKNLDSLKKNHETVLNNMEEKQKNIALNTQKTIRELETECANSRVRVKELENKINYNLNGELTNYKNTNDRLQRDLENAKNLERNMTKQLRSVQLKLSAVNGQLENMKSKTSSSQTMFKLQTERLHSEIKSLKEQLQKQILKGLGLKEKSQQVSGQNSLLQSKLAHQVQLHNKAQKENENRLSEYGRLVKNLQQQLQKKDEVNKQIIEKERNYMNKIKQYNINESEYVDILGKYENDINSYSKQTQALQEKLRAKSNEFDKLTLSTKNLEQKYEELSNKYKDSSVENKELLAEKNALHKQKNDLSHQLRLLKDSLTNKETLIEKLKSVTEQESKAKSVFKDDLVKLENKAEAVTKEHTMFKEHLYDLIARQFGNIQGLDINLYINENQNLGSRYLANNDHIIEGDKSSRNEISSTHMISHKSDAPSQNEIINAITSFTKQTKAIISSLKDQVKETTSELQQLHNELYQANNTLNETIKQKTQTIYDLQKKLDEQINLLATSKKEYQKKNDNLKVQLKSLQNQLEDTLSKNQQLMFNINGIQMAKEADRNYYQQTIKESKDVIHNLENSYGQMYEKNTSLQLQKNQLSLQLRFVSEQLTKVKGELNKKIQKIQKLEGQQSMKDSLIGQLKSKNKEQIQKITEIELILSTQKQMNENNKKALSEEEKKLLETKDFINNLIKQKQVILKEQINNKQRCLELQASNLHLNNRIQSLQASQERINKQLQTEKETNKKLYAQVRNLEVQLQGQQQKHRRASERLKDKERELNTKLEASQVNQNSLGNELSQKSREMKERKQQIEMLRKLHNQQISNYQQENNKLEDQLFKIKEQLKYGLYALENSNKELHRAKNTIQEKISEINTLKEISKSLEESKSQLDLNINNLLQELRDKDERMYEMAGEMSSLQSKYQQRIVLMKRQQTDIEENMNYKYEAMCEDYEIRIQQIEKQRDYLNQKIKVIEEELKKMEQKVRMVEYEDNQLLMRSQDRLIKSEQQKNVVISNLRAQIHKLTEQKATAIELNFKYSTEVQNLKTSMRNLQILANRQEQKNKELEEKIKQLKDEISSNQQQMRQTMLQSKQLQELIGNYQWTLQREVKKQFQKISKNLINCFSDSQSKQRRQFIEEIQGVESRVINLVNSKINK